MARSLSLLACASALAVAQSGNSADECAAVTTPAPCGQQSDSEAICLTKGCCFNPAFSSTPCFYPSYNAIPITTVRVVQASHFDAGFADSTVNILNLWFTSHIPRCSTIGAALQALGGPAQLKFTMQSWIVDLYLNCPPNAGLACPDGAAVAAFKSAVNAGWITWHAFPFNAELELYSPFMLGVGVNISRALDAALGAAPKRVLSQRDVPGTTRSAIPLLLQLGVDAITVGVNGGSTPPKVPRAFTWCDNATAACMAAMWHPYGYGGIGREDAVILPNSSTAIVFDWRGDNAGPYDNTAEALMDWMYLNLTFPGASIVASTLEVAMEDVRQSWGLLPVLTDEIGDTWIHGAGSDPQKSAWFKRGQVLIDACIASGACNASDAAFQNFTRFYLKNGEHTWGKDIKSYLHDVDNWSNAQLAAHLNDSNFQDVMRSWAEQREYGFTYALQALPDGHPLKSALMASMASIVPGPAPQPTAPTWKPYDGSIITAGRFQIALEPASCSISYLKDTTRNQVWMDLNTSAVRASLLEYHTYSAADYSAFLANYSAVSPPPSYFPLDFGKPNMSEAGAVHQEMTGSCSGSWVASDSNSITLLSSLQLLDANGTSSPHESYGAPGVLWMTLVLPTDASDGTLNLTLSAYNKTSTRLPEAAFLRFNATSTWGDATGAPVSLEWSVDKLGGWVDPFRVVMGGNQHHHVAAVRGVQVVKRDPAGVQPDAVLRVSSQDAVLTVWGAPFGLPTPHNVTADAAQGFGFYMWDNLWGTNYPMWMPWGNNTGVDSSMQWQFSMTLA